MPPPVLLFLYTFQYLLYPCMLYRMIVTLMPLLNRGLICFLGRIIQHTLKEQFVAGIELCRLVLTHCRGHVAESSHTEDGIGGQRGKAGQIGDRGVLQVNGIIVIWQGFEWLIGEVRERTVKHACGRIVQIFLG